MLAFVGRTSPTAVYLRSVQADPCAYCGALATDLDHIEARVVGSDGWENLTAACGTCNKRKGQLSLLGFLIRRGLIDDGLDEMREQWARAA